MDHNPIKTKNVEIIRIMEEAYMQKADYIRKLKIENMDRIAAYRRQLYENPRLRDLFIEVTSRCNAHCDHCGSRCDSRVQPDEVTAEALKNTLLEISRTYDPQDILLNITGGEPLMREDLFDIMGYASNLGFRWGMTSNGMLIDDDVIEKMVETGMETISISIDGLKETHESFRHVPNSFDRIIENIKKLQQTPSIKIVQVTTVVSKRNIHELESLYELMQDIDIVSWRIINVDPIGRAMDNKDILLDPKDYRYLFEFIKEKRKEDLIENIEYGCAHYLGTDLEKELRDTYFICCAGLYVASILSNGDIFACPDIERRPELIQGNIRKDSFVEIWENGFKAFRTENRTSCKKCRSCENWGHCCGDSFHTWDFDKNEPRFCIKNIYPNRD